MGNVNFTPGPWTVVVDEIAAQVRGYPCVYSKDYTVVGTEGMYGDIDVDFANAKLIAAAPDLYEALQRIQNTIGSSANKQEMEILEYCRIALSKAQN